MARIESGLHNIGVVLMASGSGRRMGENKLMLPLGDPPKACIRRVTEEFVAVGVGQIVVVYADESVKEVLKDLNVTFIKNEKSELGKSESVKLGAAFPWHEHICAIAFAAGDQPLLQGTEYRRIFTSYLESGANIGVPVAEGDAYSPKVFDLMWRDMLLKVSGDSGGKGIMNHPEAKICEIPFEEAQIFADMDTPKDYEALSGLINTLESWRVRG